MRKRYQTGHVFARGKRRRVWVARYLEPVLQDGRVKSVLRSRVLGSCKDMSKSEARTLMERNWLRPINEGLCMPVESAASFQDFYDKWARTFCLLTANPRGNSTAARRNAGFNPTSLTGESLIFSRQTFSGSSICSARSAVGRY
jgi:hypothetical protein